MTDARTLLQSALEFAEFCWREVPLNDYAEEKREALEQSIRSHLAAEQQEPVAAGVAWVMGDDGQKTLGPKCCDKTVAVRCPGYPHDAPPAAPAPEIESLVRDIHKAVKRGEDTQDHGLIGNLRCILDHVLPDPPDMTAPAPVVPLTDEEIALAIFEARVGHSPFKRDGSTSFRIARAVEQAVLAKMRAVERAHGIGVSP